MQPPKGVPRSKVTQAFARDLPPWFTGVVLRVGRIAWAFQRGDGYAHRIGQRALLLHRDTRTRHDDRKAKSLGDRDPTNIQMVYESFEPILP
jgi:hypothetical protein